MTGAEMTPEEFDRRLEAGRPVTLDVRIRNTKLPLYTVALTHGGAFSSATVRPTRHIASVAVEQQVPTPL